MTTHTFDEIGAAARRLHWNYGAGDVAWTHVYADGRIELCAKRTYGQPRVYIGHICNRGRSVRLHGHQALIGFLQQYGDTRKVVPSIWRCCACGCVTAIGNKPVQRGCKCLES